MFHINDKNIYGTLATGQVLFLIHSCNAYTSPPEVETVIIHILQVKCEEAHTE